MKLKTLSLLAAGVIVMAVPAHAIYIADNVGNLWNLNVATNTSTSIGNNGLGNFFYDIALDPTSGNLYGILGGTQLASINTTTGVGTLIGGPTSFINALTFDSSGTLFGTGGTSLFTVNTSTGAATTVGSTGFDSSGDIAFDSGGNLFMSAIGSISSDQLVSLNSGTGAGTLVGNIGFSNVYGLNFSGSILNGFTLDGRTLEINTTNGVGSFVATNSIHTAGADGSGGVIVPDTGSTIALLGLAITGIAGARRKLGLV